LVCTIVAPNYSSSILHLGFMLEASSEHILRKKDECEKQHWEMPSTTFSLLQEKVFLSAPAGSAA
jgi:hypothetical protein